MDTELVLDMPALLSTECNAPLQEVIRLLRDGWKVADVRDLDENVAPGAGSERVAVTLTR